MTLLLYAPVYIYPKQGHFLMSIQPSKSGYQHWYNTVQSTNPIQILQMIPPNPSFFFPFQDTIQEYVLYLVVTSLQIFSNLYSSSAYPCISCA